MTSGCPTASSVQSGQVGLFGRAQETPAATVDRRAASQRGHVLTLERPLWPVRVQSPRQKPTIRLDDLIPNEKVLGGRRVTFGVRAKPFTQP